MTDSSRATFGDTVRAPRWMRFALVISLAINLAIAGALAGSALVARMHPQVDRPAYGGLMAFSKTLPPERRVELWAATAEERRAFAPVRAEVNETRQQARAALLENPFNSERHVEAQARVFEAEVKARRASKNILLKLADVMTPAERSAFGAWLPPKPRMGRARGMGYQVQDPAGVEPETRRK